MDAESENRTNAETVLDALREIEGVDDKLLKRPELAHLPSVLEEDELPGCIASFNPVGIVVATDRRIISIRKSRWGYSIKSVDSYPYTDIHSIEAGQSMWELPLGVQIISSGKRVRIDADKDWRFRFADYVTAKLSHNPVVEALRKLEGVDEDFLNGPEVAHLASVLEEDELPGCVTRTARDGALFATDRRIIHIEQSLLSSSIEKVDSYPYDEIQWVSTEKGIFKPHLEIMVSGKIVRLQANRDSRFAFAEHVRAMLSSNPVLALLKEDLSKLEGVDEKLLGSPEVARLASVLEEAEVVELIRPIDPLSVTAVTDRRIIHIQRRTSDFSSLPVETYPYENIESIGMRSSLVAGGATLPRNWVEIRCHDGTARLRGRRSDCYAIAEYVNLKLEQID